MDKDTLFVRIQKLYFGRTYEYLWKHFYFLKLLLSGPKSKPFGILEASKTFVSFITEATILLTARTPNEFN